MVLRSTSRSAFTSLLSQTRMQRSNDATSILPHIVSTVSRHTPSTVYRLARRRGFPLPIGISKGFAGKVKTRAHRQWIAIKRWFHMLLINHISRVETTGREDCLTLPRTIKRKDGRSISNRSLTSRSSTESGRGGVDLHTIGFILYYHSDFRMHKDKSQSHSGFSHETADKSVAENNPFYCRSHLVFFFFFLSVPLSLHLPSCFSVDRIVSIAPFQHS